ncbi:MAG: hypothetical protein KKA32_07965 [Actinobacteria bacterium]|nr:hypothetical protein [Actinomycetota bacterium]
MAKKYDPLWEIVGQKLPLQGTEVDVDALCPVCHVSLHVGAAEPGQNVDCGLCGAGLLVVERDGVVTLED